MIKIKIKLCNQGPILKHVKNEKGEQKIDFMCNKENKKSKTKERAPKKSGKKCRKYLMFTKRRK